MTVAGILLAVAGGYLVGSISFAALIARILGRGTPLSQIHLPVPGTEQALSSNAVSATAVRLQYGARYGCLTSVLDMAKAAAITLAFKQIAPGQPLLLIASGMTVVGHIWPLYLRFRGGRGQSPIIGSLFVIDWPAALIVFPAAQVLGILTRTRPYTARFGPELLLAAWFWYRFASVPHVLFAVGLLLIRVIAMRRELRQFHQLRKQGHLHSLADEFAFLDGSPRLRRCVDRLTRRRSSKQDSDPARD